MSVPFSREVKKIIYRMENTVRKYELEAFNSLVLIDALLTIPQFSSALEHSSFSDQDEIFDFDQEVLETWFSEGKIEITEAQKRMTQKLQENGIILSENKIFSKDLIDIFEYAEAIVKEEKRTEISVEDLVISLLANQDATVKTFFEEIGTDIEQFEEFFNEVVATECLREMLPVSLASFVTVLNDKFQDNPDCAILGREKECAEIWKTMMKKTKRNLILVGEPGVGKSSIVYKITCDIVNGNCPEMFKNFLVLSLDVNSLIADTTFRGQAEKRYKDLIEYLSSHDKVILFIDEIHMIVGAGSCSHEDNQDFSNALKPILAGDNSIVIGATTEEEYEKAFSLEGALKRRFRKITVEEPKTTEVHAMLKDSIKQLEKFHGVKISKKMVEFIIFNSSCFNYETRNPDRTKDLIDLSMVTAKMDGKKRVDRTSVMKNFDMNFKNFHNMSAEQIMATAYHEIGHYLMWRFSGRLTDREIVAISIIPADSYIGVNVFDGTDTFPTADSQFFIDSIAMLLSGRIAEEMFSGSYTSGASDDLERATKLAYDMVTRYGLSPTFTTNRVYLRDAQYQMQTNNTINSINSEIDKIMDIAYNRAKQVLNEHSVLLDHLVNIISEKGMMSKLELENIVQVYLNHQKVLT